MTHVAPFVVDGETQPFLVSHRCRHRRPDRAARRGAGGPARWRRCSSASAAGGWRRPPLTTSPGRPGSRGPRSTGRSPAARTSPSTPCCATRPARFFDRVAERLDEADTLEDLLVIGSPRGARIPARPRGARVRPRATSPSGCCPRLAFHRLDRGLAIATGFVAPRLARFVPDPSRATDGAEFVVRALLSYAVDPSPDGGPHRRRRAAAVHPHLHRPCADPLRSPDHDHQRRAASAASRRQRPRGDPRGHQHATSTR